MAGIIEPDTGAAMFRGPGVQRQGLGAPHVGIEAAEPEQPGPAAGTGPYGDPAAATALSHLDKGRLVLNWSWICHSRRPLCPRARFLGQARPDFACASGRRAIFA